MDTSAAEELSEVSLVILDVGHGNAAFVHEGDSTVLIDAAAGSHVLEYLTQSGISDISKVLLSHSDYDHIGGLIALLNNGITIRSIVVNGDASKKSEAWRDLVFSLEDARRRGDVEFTVGMSSGYINVPGFVRCEVEVVAPIPEIAALGVGATDRLGRRITSNSISAGVRISVDGRPIVLLSGDMDEISLDGSLQGGADLMADILVFPHHGGHSGGQDVKAFAAKFLSAVTPTHVLFSHGRNKHENPREEAIVASVEAGAVVACTQLSNDALMILQALTSILIAAILLVAARAIVVPELLLLSSTGRYSPTDVRRSINFLLKTMWETLCAEESQYEIMAESPVADLEESTKSHWKGNDLDPVSCLRFTCYVMGVNVFKPQGVSYECDCGAPCRMRSALALPSSILCCEHSLGDRLNLTLARSATIAHRSIP